MAALRTFVVEVEGACRRKLGFEVAQAGAFHNTRACMQESETISWWSSGNGSNENGGAVAAPI